VGVKSTWAGRLYRRLARRLLPARHWERFGPVQCETFDDLYAEARARGGLRATQLIFRELWDLGSTAIRERRTGQEEVMKLTEWPVGKERWYSDLWRDVAYATRSLRKHWRYSTVVVAILALGIATTAGVFTVVNGVLFRPLPYEESEELVLVWSVLDSRSEPGRMTVSPADFLDWKRSAESFERLAAHNLWFPVISSGEGDAERLFAGRVSSEFFDVLGVQPLLGRTFRAEESDGPHQVVLLSYGLWRSRFGGDPGVVGRDVRVNGQPHEVVGVLPADYRHPDPHRPLMETELFAPFDMQEWVGDTGRFLRVFGRLSTGVSIAQAQQEMDAITLRLQDVRPVENIDTGAEVISMRDQFFGSSRSALLIVLAGAGVIFLIVCANLTSLALARGLTRRREFAVRASLGAGRRRIARQILVENGILALLGSGCGVLAVLLAIDVIRGVQGRVLPVVGDIRVDYSVIAFAVVLALLTTLMLGLLPLGEFFRTPVRAVLTEESAGGGGSRRSQRIRSALVIAEVALAAALVVGAGLLGRSFQELSSVGPGFAASEVLTAQLSAPPDRYEDGDAIRAFYEEVKASLAALPAVEQVAYASELPMLDGNWFSAFDLVDQPLPREQWPSYEIRYVSPDYFSTMGIPVLAGREFASSDVPEGNSVVVVNRSLARRAWGREDVVGERLRWEWRDEERISEVVGVVDDVLDNGLSSTPDPFVYFSFAQRTTRGAAFVLRAGSDPTAIAGSVRGVVRELDNAVPVTSVDSYANQLAATIAAPRFASVLATLFSLVALVVAGLGIYGLLSYAVGSRTREIGIRTALGAGGGDVARLVVRQSLALTTLGVVLGVGVALAEGRLLESLLFGVSATDPTSLLLAPAVLLGVALVASYLPARKAVSVQPVEALRSESR
jgi:predicted permease